MSRLRNFILIPALVAGLPAIDAVAGTFGLGRPAAPAEIAAWDRDVRPDGRGLPVGSGNVEAGEEIFADRCATCHGDFGEGLGLRPALVGGFDTLDGNDPVKTLGSFWPYLSTAFDYIRRSKPYGNAQTLTDDEVYAVVAYLLYSNDLVADDFVLSRQTFPDIEMPNRAGFVVDDRAQTEYPVLSRAPCMNDCKDEVRITLRASALDVTPDQPDADGPATGRIADGERAFAACRPCHEVGAGAKNTTGPVLTGIVGKAAGAVEGFEYSDELKKAAGNGLKWTEEDLAAFLGGPETFLRGTKMSFAGIAKQEDIAAIIAYLRYYGE